MYTRPMMRSYGPTSPNDWPLSTSARDVISTRVTFAAAENGQNDEQQNERKSEQTNRLHGREE